MAELHNKVDAVYRWKNKTFLASFELCCLKVKYVTFLLTVSVSLLKFELFFTRALWFDVYAEAKQNFDVGGLLDFLDILDNLLIYMKIGNGDSDNCIWLKKREYKKIVIMHRKQSLLIAEALGKFIKGVINYPIRAI